MIRPLLTEFVLFVAPFLAYAVFLIATRAGIFDPQSWPPRVLFWLTAIALVSMIGSFIVIAHFAGEDIGSTYVPARIEDGKFIPGQLK